MKGIPPLAACQYVCHHYLEIRVTLCNILLQATWRCHANKTKVCLIFLYFQEVILQLRTFVNLI